MCPKFRSNRVALALKEIGPAQQQVIADVLYALYGTPDEPFVPEASGLDLKKLQVAAGPVQGLGQGLYRRHCVHCHGTTGDGMGPTAAILNPYPRLPARHLQV